MEQQLFTVIGLSDGRELFLPPHIERIIRNGEVFSGGVRHRQIMENHLPHGALWIDITTPLDDVFRQYAGHSHVVVFASGDPLFFGFATTIQKRLPQARVVTYPAFNSLQMLAHELTMPYHDMQVVSLTGRPWQEFDNALIRRTAKMGVLTDREHTPATIAARMLYYGYSGYTLFVGECLGNEEEQRIRTLSLEEASKESFKHPNNLILLAQGEGRPRYFGIPDGEFELLHNRDKMITKAPLRLMDLSVLGLQNRRSFWDVGFCTGSVSIEARLQFPHLLITSFEIRPEGEQLMEANSRRFGAPGIRSVIGDFTVQDLSSLPAPDAVFIGGHGGKLKEMMEQISRVLLPGGIVVFNSVSENSYRLFLEAVETTPLTLQNECLVALDDNNPIRILSAVL